MQAYYIKRIPRNKKFPKLQLLLATVVLLAALFVIFYTKPKQVQTAQPFFTSINKLVPVPKVDKDDAAITNKLKTEVEKLPGRYGIILKNLKTNAIYQINPKDTFASASLYKLAVLYKTYDALEKGELQKDDMLSSDKITLDKMLTTEIGDDSSSTETVSLTVENALRAMITMSDNYSALLLAEKLGWQNIEDFLFSQGISGFNLTTDELPETTPEATKQILEKIYTNTAVSPSASAEMKLLLFGQRINDRIPKYLPDSVKVAHKTGEIDNFRHDAGIVLGKKNNYIFVFLSETPAPADAVENIADLSKTFYEALEAT